MNAHPTHHAARQAAGDRLWAWLLQPITDELTTSHNNESGAHPQAPDSEEVRDAPTRPPR